jgi:hypothetical protein
MSKKSDVNIKIIKPNNKIFILKDMINMKITESIKEYVGHFEILLDNKKGKYTKLCDPQDELEIWVKKLDKKSTKMMAGYIDKIEIERKEDSDPTIKIVGRDYNSILVDTKVSGKILFQNGFGSIIKELFKNTSFHLSNIKETKEKGSIIFNNIFLLDLIKYLAEEKSFMFKIDYDKKIYFEPIKPPKNSGVTLTTKDIKSIKLIKESD